MFCSEVGSAARRRAVYKEAGLKQAAGSDGILLQSKCREFH